MKRKIAKIGDKVIIAQSEYDNTSDGSKGIWTAERWDWDDWETIRGKYIGKREWMPPFSLFDKTCLLVEGEGFSIISDKEFDKRYGLSLQQAYADGYCYFVEQ